MAAAAARFDPDVDAAVRARYGLDVMDLGVTLRRVHHLVSRLPGDAWWHAPDSPAAWSTEAHLMAAVLDAVQQGTWVLSHIHGGKGPRPKPVPRPGDKPKREAAQPIAGRGWLGTLAQAMGRGGPV